MVFAGLYRMLRSDIGSGILLIASAAMALVLANSPLSHWYDLLMNTPVMIGVGEFEIHKPLLLWINDGLMAIFFFLVGLELKRELVEGELSKPNQLVLPLVAAAGGMIVPAGIYLLFTYDDPVTAAGWAIPAATDIAFALGILMLLGKRVPIALKIFLTSLAIFDDVGAIIIIALFYTSDISYLALLVVSLCIPVLFILNRNRISRKSAYILISVVIWVAMLKSGVHATLAGVLVAMFIPLHSERGTDDSPLKSMEEDLHGLVYYGVLPIFAFANAGLDLSNIGIDNLTHPVSLGVILGLFIGKQVGIMLFSLIVIKLGFTRLPDKVTWGSLYGVSILCGIGFTMSLFIGSLAFGQSNPELLYDERFGILVGSILSAFVGYFVLNLALKKQNR